MAELDEIFAERDRAPGESQQDAPAATQRQPDLVRDQAAAPSNIGDRPAESPAESADQGQEPLTEREKGLHAARDAEREKVKRYKDQVASFEHRQAEQGRMIAGMAAQIQQLSQFIQQSQRPAAPPPPDFYEDQGAALSYHINNVLEQALQPALAPVVKRLERSEQKMAEWQARGKYGDDVVEQAYLALEQYHASGDPTFDGVYERMMSMPNPYAAMVEWHKQQQERAELSDPVALRDKIRTEILAELQQQPDASRGQAAPPQIPNMMPSGGFASGRNVGSRSGPTWGGPASLNDIFDFRDKKGR